MSGVYSSYSEEDETLDVLSYVQNISIIRRQMGGQYENMWNEGEKSQDLVKRALSTFGPTCWESFC